MDDNTTAVDDIDIDLGTDSGDNWLDIGTSREVNKARRIVVEGDEPILVVAHEGSYYAMANICIHKQRELMKGVVLNGRLVCPGHQWAFDLQCGWESVKNECQPTYTVRVTDEDRVEIDLDSRTVLLEPPAGG